MATIELDIIKQRSDKLLPSEKVELINYLVASLPPEQEGLTPEIREFARSQIGNSTDEPPA